jgi:hypothetical protein
MSLLFGPQTIGQLTKDIARNKAIVAKGGTVPGAGAAVPIPAGWSHFLQAHHLGVVEGTSPPYGYGYGADMFRGQAVPDGFPPPSGYGYGEEAYRRGRGPSVPARGKAYAVAKITPTKKDMSLPGAAAWRDAPYPSQFYGYDNHAQLDGYHFGSFTDTINSIIGTVTNAATKVENIARGIAVGSQAAQTVTQNAAQQGGTLFQPSPADLAARQIDVTSLLGGANLVPLAVIGGGLLLVLLMRRKS